MPELEVKGKGAYLYIPIRDILSPLTGERTFEVRERPVLLAQLEMAELTLNEDERIVFTGVTAIHYAGDISARPAGAGKVLDIESGVFLIILDDRAFLIKISPSENGYLISTHEISSRFAEQRYDIAVAEYIFTHASDFQIDFDDIVIEYAAVYSHAINFSADVSYSPPEWFTRGEIRFS